MVCWGFCLVWVGFFCGFRVFFFFELINSWLFKDGWTSKFLEVVFKHLVHIYCDYSTSNIFAVRGEKDCPSGELEREFNSSFFFRAV